MHRRKFLQNISLFAGSQFVLNGVAFQTLQGQPRLSKMAQNSTNDKVLVIIQMHGGNDGLNAVIPIPQYNLYYNMRPNLAIPDSGTRKYIRLDGTLKDEQLVGLHPDMVGMKSLYDEGKLAILQNVGYENMNGSHFKGRDIWFGGAGAADRITSGWLGRFLENEFEGAGGTAPQYPLEFPNPEMLDPLGLEFATDVSLGFHTEDTIPAAISIPNPATFFDDVKELAGFNEEIKIDPRGFPPATNTIPDLYRQELQWILDIEKGTDKYAERLQKVYKQGAATTVTYPQTYAFNNSKNPIADKLAIIARLVHGGCKTKVYLVRIGGFDTHINQVESYDNTLGHHAALMYHISSAMKAFQDDLKARGIEDRLLTLTVSEFGRRAVSNNNYGSDHGTVAPMFVFGSQVNPGVIGKNPDLAKVSQNYGNLSDNVEDITDFRVVFNTILQDWFEVSTDDIRNRILPSLNKPASAGWGDPDIGDKVPLLRSNQVTAIDAFMNRRFRLDDVYPNPVRDLATFSFYIDNPAKVQLGLYDNQGRLVRMLLNENRQAGKHEVPVHLAELRSGMYVYRINAGLLKGSKKLVKL